jgi:hypothetical protein
MRAYMRIGVGREVERRGRGGKDLRGGFWGVGGCADRLAYRFEDAGDGIEIVGAALES